MCVISFEMGVDCRYEKGCGKLDESLPSLDSPDEIAKFEDVKDFPYLNAAI